MIIKKISIENYMCYYGVNHFEFANGLNIILGENGEGKTKFFEAIEWLFKGDIKHLASIASAKKLNEVTIGESFVVSVSMQVEQYDEQRYLTRAFNVTKDGDLDCTTSKPYFEGIEENKLGERAQVDAERLLSQVFPNEIRKYSLFKGESELNVFKNDDALINLINLFSNSRYYDKYATKGKALRMMAEEAVTAAARRNTTNQNKYTKIQADIRNKKQQQKNFNDFLESAESQLNKLNGELQKAEKFVYNAEALEVENKRIGKIEAEISTHLGSIQERYTTYLFDDSWILSGFEPVFERFKEKVNSLNSKRRVLQREFDLEEGRKQGARENMINLLNDALPLNFNVPNKEVMEELIRDEHCKVCDTPAPKGSHQYEFMKKRLAAYLESQNPSKKEEIEQLFKNDYISDLVIQLNLNNDKLVDLRNVPNKIKELFKFNQQRKSDIEELTEKLDKEKDERIKILGNSTGTEESLGHVLKNYNGWQADKEQVTRRVDSYNKRIDELVKEIDELEKKKDEIDLESANSFLVKSREIIRDVELIFEETKEARFDEFLKLLQDKANGYFEKVNKGAFTGNIVFQKHKLSNDKVRIEVELFEGDRRFYNPNQSLATSMHISILFAISKLAEENRQEGFPLIFDAPTSSFGSSKTSEFLNIISSTSNQIILLIKDFIGKDEQTENLFIKPEFKNVKRQKALWVKLERPFDSNNLRTLNSEVIAL